MYVTPEQMKRINQIQVGILREVADVCRQLNIRFYMVHGSLLGTIRNSGFIPNDDDIDIAMMRSDYELFMEKAPSLISNNYFVQHSTTDEHYPLRFAKVRDSRTTYICETVRKIDMHHGIYIDIFPIDYACEIKNPFCRFREKFMDFRIACALSIPSRTWKHWVGGLVSCMAYPSLRKTVLKRIEADRNCAKSNWLRITGGKDTEHKLPAQWFAEVLEREFEGITVYIPKEYDSYLRRIYGGYENRTLVEGKMHNGKIELNASVFDTERSYIQYFRDQIGQNGE